MRTLAIVGVPSRGLPLKLVTAAPVLANVENLEPPLDVVGRQPEEERRYLAWNVRFAVLLVGEDWEMISWKFVSCVQVSLYCVVCPAALVLQPKLNECVIV